MADVSDASAAAAEIFVPSEATLIHHNNIWSVDYNATVAKDAAMGWQGLGYVLAFNTALFVIAFIIFQNFAKSTRFSLFHFRSSSNILSGNNALSFTLRSWQKLLFHTPIRDTEVEIQLGPEGTFYLMYQVYALRLLAVLSIYAFIVLLPLYLGIAVISETIAEDVAKLPELPSFFHHTNESSTDITPTSSTLALILAEASGSRSNDSDSSSGFGNATIVDDDNWWSFAHSTIRVLPNESPYLWVPVITCYFFTIAFMVFFQRLSFLSSIPRSSSSSSPSSSSKSITSEAASNGSGGSSNDITDEQQPEEEKKPEEPERRHLIGMQPSELSARSLFIDRGLPKTLREERMLYLMEEVFPGYVEDVSVVLNMAEFHSYQHRRWREENNLERERILHQKRENKERISWALRLLPGSMTFPSLAKMLECRPKPFEEREQLMQTKIELLKEAEKDSLHRILRQNNGAGRAFIVFRTARLRARFVRRVRNRSITSILADRFPDHALPKIKRYIRELGVTRWHLSTAPEPDDIDWNSVSFPLVKRTTAVLLVNVAILALLLLFTSPIAVTSAISNSNSYSTNAAQSISDLVAQISDFIGEFAPQMAKMMTTYFPTLILVMINAVLLNVLQIAGRIQPIATDSAKERMILRTASVYLIFNTIFVPSLAFVSIDAVLLYLENDGEVLSMLGTLFLHNSGIFYCSYVLQRCFLGTAVVMLRASEFAKFSWFKPRAVTPREHVKSVEAWPFFTGVQSALQISMLTVVLTFSTVVPLILPLGMLYFVMQHAVDKYSLLHVRPRIKGRGSIARTATHATIISLLLYLTTMAGFFLVRGTKMQGTCVLVLLMVTYIVCLWWYIRDKERAYAQTTRAHSSNSRRHLLEKNGVNPDSLASGISTEPTEETRLLVECASASQLEAAVPIAKPVPLPLADERAKWSDFYREPALRKLKHSSLGLDPRQIGEYGSTWRKDFQRENTIPNLQEMENTSFRGSDMSNLQDCNV